VHGAPDAALAVQINQIDRKSHKKGMYCFTGDDPEAGAVVQLIVFQEAGPSLRTILRCFNSITYRCAPRYVTNPEFQVPCYNTDS
jgi:hypothetical protein